LTNPGSSSSSSSPGPSSRIRPGITTRPDSTRSKPDTTPGGNTPITPARTIDRDKILERYNRASGSTGRTPSAPADRDATARTPGIRQPGASSGATDKRAPKTADQIAHERNQYRLDHADELRAKRQAQHAEQIKDARDGYRAGQADSLAKRRDAIAKTQATRNRNLVQAGHWDDVCNQGNAVSCGSNWGLTIGVNVGLGCCSPFGWCSAYYNCGWQPYCNPYWYNYNSCYYWNACGGYPWSWYCHPFSLCYGYWYGCWPYSIATWYPSYDYYYQSPPAYYTTVVEDRYYSDDNGGGGYSNEEPAQQQGQGDAQNGESVEYSSPVRGQAAPAAPSNNSELEQLLGHGGPDSAARASAQYLSLGDEAFRDRRYSDSVHFYAKAIEFRPDEGVLYLVLSDALFATGDYHYGAFALRRALELDSTLAASDIDKRSFYTDASEFETQLQTLERFLSDRPTDADARLLLAANYLFSGRALLANDLLESGASESVRNEPAGKLVLDAAKKAIASKK
jgi:hypothetical protein